MSSEKAKKDYPDKDKRYAVAESMWKKKGSREKEALYEVTDYTRIKEIDDDVEHEFYAATTLPDRTAEYDSSGKKVIDGEVLTKPVLDKIASLINDQSTYGGKAGAYRTVSLFHDRVHSQDQSLEEAGYIKNAEVVPLENHPGHWGLRVQNTVNQFYNPSPQFPDYTPEKIEYKIKQKALGLSLEYVPNKDAEHIEATSDGKFRIVEDIGDFRGFGYARANVIGSPYAVAIKEIASTNEGRTNMADENQPDINKEIAQANERIKELTSRMEALDKDKDEARVKELQGQITEFGTKIKEMKVQQDEFATRIKEAIENAFATARIKQPLNNDDPAEPKDIRIKEMVKAVNDVNWKRYSDLCAERVKEQDEYLKKKLMTDGINFDTDTTLRVKCVGRSMIIVPSEQTTEMLTRTKDVITSDSMAESTYNQTNAMFADRYVPGITETFLKDDTLLKAMYKENYQGGNDKYQWRIWTDFDTFTGDNTLSVDPDNTSVSTTKRKFIKLETPIREYRDAVEVTDFTRAHAIGAVGDLLQSEIIRAAEAVTNSMNADLYKGKCDATTGWTGFNGLLAIADSASYATLYGKTRTASNRLLDSTTANTYDSTPEGISVALVREMYEKVLAHGSQFSNLAGVTSPTQVRRLFNSYDSASSGGSTTLRFQPLTMASNPEFGFKRDVMPHVDGMPIIRDNWCVDASGDANTFIILDMSPDKGFVLVVSKPLGLQGLAKVGTSEKAYVSFWGQSVYKSPRNIMLHDDLTTT